jgi:hypothetical protein
MDVIVALILSCSVHFDDHLVEALAAKMSLDNQYFVGDLSNLNTYDGAHSVAEAHELVDKILAKGGRPAVGYLSVPVAWAQRFGRTPDDLFDGCVNVGVATAMLSEYAHACTARPTGRRPARMKKRRPPPINSPDVRACILRRLEADLNITGIVEHVLPDIARLDGKPPDPDDDPPPARAPLYPDNTNNARLNEPGDWSSPRLYFFPSPTAQSEGAPVGVSSATQRVPVQSTTVPSAPGASTRQASGRQRP